MNDDGDDPRPALMLLLAALVAFVAGFAVWAVFSLVGGLHEAWDGSAWWSLGLPILVVAAAVCGYMAPAGVWRWSLLVVLGQFVGVLLVHPPGTGWGLLPLTILFVEVPMAVILTIPALLGGMVARGGWDRALLVRP
jgi:hypothetical protein